MGWFEGCVVLLNRSCLWVAWSPILTRFSITLVKDLMPYNCSDVDG